MSPDPPLVEIVANSNCSVMLTANLLTRVWLGEELTEPKEKEQEEEREQEQEDKQWAALLIKEKNTSTFQQACTVYCVAYRIIKFMKTWVHSRRSSFIVFSQWDESRF